MVPYRLTRLEKMGVARVKLTKKKLPEGSLELFLLVVKEVSWRKLAAIIIVRNHLCSKLFVLKDSVWLVLKSL